MYTARGFLAFLIALSLPQTAGAAPVEAPLPPVGKWVVDFASANCSASRNYGDPAKPIIFGIRPAPNGETFELMAVFPRRASNIAEESPGTVDFGRGPIKAWLLRYGSKPEHVIYSYRIRAAQMAQAQSATAVTLRAKGAATTTFALANLPNVLSTLQKCTADLQRYWNMNGEKDGTVVQPARTRRDLRYLFSAGDYPAEAVSRGQEGSGQFLLLIDETGSVAGCHVVKTTGIPVFDGMSCNVLRERAKFSPAIGRDGKPVRSTVVTPEIVYRIEI